MSAKDDYEAELLGGTQRIIEAFGEEIVLVRPPTKVRQPDGSVRANAGDQWSTLPAQNLFFSGVSGDNTVHTTWQGSSVVADFVLLGMPQADIREGDTFTYMGRGMVVSEMHTENRWCKKALVVHRGPQ